MTDRERLLKALDREAVDRPPVICPGGMMSAAVMEVMEASGYGWPRAHAEVEAMAGLALAMYDLGAIENLAVPFCMTVEAEALGAEVTLGDTLTQPRVALEPYDSARELLQRDLPVIAASARSQVLLEAIRQVRAARPDAPVVGNLVGPVSLAASLAKPDLLLREVFRQPDLVREALERLTGLLVEFGKAQLTAGAEVIAIADPTTTGEILGPRAFEQLAAPALARLTRELQQAGARVIVHICGNVHTIAPLLAGLGADAISVDDMVNLRKLREQAPDAAIMGNVCALHLEEGPVTRIKRWVRNIGLRQADIIAPACAIVPATPLRHLQALVQAASDGGAEL